MLIKVKIIDDNGKPKGRGYTYKSGDIDVNVGDLIVADMAGKDKILIVSEIDVPEEKVDFEIKTIKGLAEEVTDVEIIEETATIEFKVEKEIVPVIKINFEELKEQLTNTLQDYKGLVVTEGNLSTCKAKQKELASTRVKIDNYRKEKKKELSKPIAMFEAQCKDLISLIEQAEEPIKLGIKVFDDEKRDMKRQQAIEISKEVAAEYGLNEKYAARLEILDKYCNLTAKSNEVKEDLITKVMTLKVEQDRENELIEIIKDTIESENEKINLKMRFEDFERYINIGMSTREVIGEIKTRANNIYLAENPPEPEPEPVPEPIEQIVEPIPEPIVEANQELQQSSESIKPIIPEEIEEPTYYAIYRIVGSHGQLLSVSQFLKNNGINYTVTDDGEL
ncbi:MAG: DUF1351 domain-containing protein [Sedimentibacter sp.]